MTPFTVYRNGKLVTISTTTEIAPIVRLCICVTESEIYLLSKNHELYQGRFTEDSDEISVILWKSDIIDIDLWKEQLYIVEKNGQVYTKRVVDDCNEWKKIVFESASNEDVIVERLKCNAIGNLYITRDNFLYGSGCSGEILTSEKPVKLKCFENRKVIDFSAGEDFFIILTTGEEIEEEDEGLSVGSSSDILETSLKHFKNSNKFNKITRSDTVELELIDDEKSNSKDSLISKSNESCCDSLQSNIKHLIHEGHNLVRTSVCSFGTSNNGVLGTGDHIKRSGLNGVLSLVGIGVCSVSSGREHSIARTLDGRLFHWGLNSEKQINEDFEVVDFSAPKELQLNNLTKMSQEESYVLDAFCEDFSTLVLKSDLKLKENGRNTFERDFVLHSTNERSFPLILAANGFVLQNHKTFAKIYQSFLISMQATVRNCIKHNFCVNFVKHFSKSAVQFNLEFSRQLCQGYLNILNILASCLQTVEDFYCGDISFEQLLFITNWKEISKVFEDYSKSYCDIKAIHGFADITRTVDLFAIGEDENCEVVFAMPFGQISNITKFIEELIKNNANSACHLNEKFLHWQNLGVKHRINIELADHTKDFWTRYAKNVQLRPFKKNHRRVILDSGNVPLKLFHAGTFSTHSFILFSDCFCQYGSQLQIYPLNALWVSIDGENSLKIITPEKNFILTTYSHDHKMVWFDQIENAIKVALGRPTEEKLSSIRMTGYTFSEKHLKYSGVRCYGRWKLGIMHGCCYLEYPDGKIYYGDMKLGDITGYGRMILPSLGLYEGYFHDGKFSGYGVYEMKDNQVYEGNFRDGLFHGHGVLRNNLYTYVGEFIGHAKSGYGVLDDCNSGSKYMGMFAENKRTGSGICVTMNGDYFEGFFVNDELCGEGVAVFENGYYYEGEMTIKGPNGKGCYYLPYKKAEEESVSDQKSIYMVGNIISGNLGGTWNDVKIINGSVSINQKFPKYPKSIGELVVNCNRKWRTLFDNWEEQVFRSSSITNVKQIWSKIAIFITNQREKERFKEQDLSQSASYFAKNITLQSNYADLSLKFSSSLDKISLRSTSSLYSRRSPVRVKSHRKSYSNETLFDRSEIYEIIGSRIFGVGDALNSFLNGTFLNDNNQSMSSRSSVESSPSFQNNIPSLDYIPSYGINSLTENDINAIKEYLSQAFKEPFHPLSILNERISSCFYTSYGCWKVKPTPILSSQAIMEWESISIRIFNIVRKMFPALPFDHCSLDGSREVVSHISLLYPIVLSEGIYSTLFVLYANKYSEQDELYRMRVLMAEKKCDIALASLLDLESNFLNVVDHDSFKEATTTFKQLTEKYCPQRMLNVIEKSIQLIEEAYKNTPKNPVILGADNIMPLTIFLVLRAGVPHLGAELALLEDLSGGSSYEGEMSGFTAYCYTTVKAAYEHIASGRIASS